MTNNPPVNINENRITFKIKTEYYLELLSPETISLLGSAEKKKTEDKIVKNVPYLDLDEALVSNKSLLKMLSKHFIFKKKHLNSEFPYVEVWFIDQDSNLL